MNLKEWWQGNETETKTVQVIVFLLAFALSSDISNATVSAAMGLAGAYIVYDCVRKKSLSGFYTAKENWLGIAVFLTAVMLASVLLGDKESIRDAFKYIYWTLPFLIMVYLGKKVEIRYAAVGGFLFSVAVTSGNMVWLHYLVLQGHKLAVTYGSGRFGAFLGNPNLYSVLLIGTLPLLFCFLTDKEVQQKTWVRFLIGAVLVLGIWSLWRTGSRGAIIGLFTGAIFTYFVICYHQKNLKQFVTGFTICVAIGAVLLLAGIRGGETRVGDVVRLRLVRSSYAMWQDHKLLGVGLANWRREYAETYILKEEIEEGALQRYQKRKKATERRAAARKAAQKKKLAAKKAATKKAAKTAPQSAQVKKQQAVQKPKKQLTPAQKEAAAQKAAAVKAAAAKREAARIAARQKAAVEREAELPMPHNVVAWFFSTTGVVGAAGYLFFCFYYIRLFCKRVKLDIGAWIVAAGFWVFLAISIHGLVDAGITNKAAARLVYMVLGISLGYNCRPAEKN